MTRTAKTNLVVFLIAALAAGGAWAWTARNNTDGIGNPADEQGMGTTQPPVVVEEENEPTEETPVLNQDRRVVLSVAFTTQAPTANWSDPRQQDGCEEASILMAWNWVNGKTSINAQEAEREIIAMSEYELEHYGNYYDLNAQYTVKLMKDYFNYDKVSYQLEVTAEDIKNALRAGKLVIVPANGKRLNNPNFSSGGPLTHMLVVKGFDEDKQQFITNDPGTRNGNGYVYSYSTLLNAMVNYPSGYHEDQTGQPNAMIVVER